MASRWTYRFDAVGERETRSRCADARRWRTGVVLMRWSTPSVPASTPSTRLGHDEGSRVRHRYPPVRHRRMEARERGRVGTRVRATQASAAAGARRTGARARRRRRRGSRSARSRATRRRTNRRTATRSWPAARRGGGGSGGPTSCSTRRRGGSRRRRTGLCAWRARRRSSCPRRRRRPRRCWTGSRATRPSRNPGPVGAGVSVMFCVLSMKCFANFLDNNQQNLLSSTPRAARTPRRGGLAGPEGEASMQKSA